MARRPRRLPRAPQDRALTPDDAIELRRELERQFRGFVELEDEEGYWTWLSAQPGFDPDSVTARSRAAEAWKEALAERRGGGRQR